MRVIPKVKEAGSTPHGLVTLGSGPETCRYEPWKKKGANGTDTQMQGLPTPELPAYIEII